MGIRRRNADGSGLWGIFKVPGYGGFLRIDRAILVRRAISGSQLWEALKVPVYGVAPCMPARVHAQPEAVTPARIQDWSVGKVVIRGIRVR